MRAKPWNLSDGLWERIEPLLPRRERRFRYPGCKPFDGRLALQGIVFVLHRDRLGALVTREAVRPQPAPVLAKPRTARTY
jgi:transposase